MSHRTVTGYYQGLDLGPHVKSLDITATGSIGRNGVYCVGPIKVVNDGTIQAYSFHYKGYDGLRLNSGGEVRNSAYIEGFTGVLVVSGSGTVANGGTIVGLGDFGYGVRLQGGGAVANGSDNDRSARIAGYDGVFVYGPSATVKNFGTITGNIGGSSVGVYLECPGRLINGSTSDHSALIEGESRGVSVAGSVSAVNFGTIASVENGGYGAFLTGSGASLTNGAEGYDEALIEGGYGLVVAYSGNTVTNFGIIEGTQGVALDFAASTDVLVVEAGCAFKGLVLGGGGTLDLATGNGSLVALRGEGSIIVSGSMAKTTFTNFATLRIGAAAQFDLAGTGTIVAGQMIVDAGILDLATGETASIVNAGRVETSGAGMLTIHGALVNNGTVIADGGRLVIDGAVTGEGSVEITAGTLETSRDFSQAVAFRHGGVLELRNSRHYDGAISGFSKTGQTTLDLLDIAFVAGSTTATYSGSGGSGVLTVTDGAVSAQITLAGKFSGISFAASDDGHGGVDVVASPKPAAFAAAMASIAAPAAHAPIAGHDWGGPRSLLAAPRGAMA